MEKMKRIKKRLSLTLRSSQTIDESLSELAEQMTIEDGGTKDNGDWPPEKFYFHKCKVWASDKEIDVCMCARKNEFLTPLQLF